MFSSIAPLARHNPFYAPHFQLVQDGVRKRPAEPAEALTTRRGLAAASADEGESGTEGPRRGEARGRAGLAVPALTPPTRACARRGGAGNAGAQRARSGREGLVLGLRAAWRTRKGTGGGGAGSASALPAVCAEEQEGSGFAGKGH